MLHMRTVVANVTHSRCHVLHMRTVVRIRNNLFRMRITVRICVTHLLRFRMCDICILTVVRYFPSGT